MKNLGKIFEENFRKSVPSDVFYYRFRDTGATFYGGNDSLRFSNTNIADNMLFKTFNVNNTQISLLYLNELKNHKGKSIPLDCIIGKKKDNGKYSKEKQIKDLIEASKYNNVICNIIVFFSDVERCFSLSIDNLIDYIESDVAKSIPISYFENYGIEIEVTKLKTNYRYNIEKWLGEF